MRWTCPACGDECFTVEQVDGVRVLTCVGCGQAGGTAPESRVAALEHELELLRTEVNRLRQAVNFLNQRVR